MKNIKNIFSWYDAQKRSKSRNYLSKLFSDFKINYYLKKMAISVIFSRMYNSKQVNIFVLFIFEMIQNLQFFKI